MGWIRANLIEYERHPHVNTEKGAATKSQNPATQWVIAGLLWPSWAGTVVEIGERFRLPTSSGNLCGKSSLAGEAAFEKEVIRMRNSSFYSEFDNHFGERRLASRPGMYWVLFYQHKEDILPSHSCPFPRDSLLPCSSPFTLSHFALQHILHTYLSLILR